MKTTNGNSFNINSVIMGRITRNKFHLINKKKYILINNGKNYVKGYACLINNNYKSEKVRYPFIYNVQNIDILRDNDIALVNRNGNIIVLFEDESDTNSIFITSKCNCNCIMCPQERFDEENNENIAINLRLIDLIPKNTKCLAITGGEPTLKKDGLIEIIRHCKNKLPNTSLLLLTNGILFESIEYVRDIVKIGHPNIDFEIPLYSDINDDHNNIVNCNGFYKTIKGIYNLYLFKQNVSLRNVILKLNYERLPQYAEFIYRNLPFIQHIAFMQMETRALALKNIDDIWIDPYLYQSELEESINMLNQRQIKISIYNAQLCILNKTLWKYARKSISLWKNIYLKECEQCKRRNDCAGFFETSNEIHSKYIKPL